MTANKKGVKMKYAVATFDTGTHEVNERQFPTATRLQCPLVA
jgi:hypothetical protein